jgi:hypothetical protein
MTFDPIAADLAVRAARATAGSARPDAPVVPERVRRQTAAGLRARLATDLHAVARWVEPVDRRPRSSGAGACQTG